MQDSAKWPYIEAASFCLALAAAVVAPLYVTNWNGEVFARVAQDPLKPKIQLWIFMIGCQGVWWVLCAVYLGWSLKTLAHLTTQLWRHAIQATIPFVVPVIAMLAYFCWARGSARPIPPDRLASCDIHHLPIFALGGIGIATFAIWQIYLIQSLRLEQQRSEGLGPETVKQLLEDRESTTHLLFVAATTLGLGVLATATFRNAVNADKRSDFFPREYVIIYGAQFSLLLVALYLPVQVSLYRCAYELRNKLFNDLALDRDSVDKWCEARRKFDDMMGLDLGVQSLIGAPLITLLPLLTGWIGNLLGKN